MPRTSKDLVVLKKIKKILADHGIDNSVAIENGILTVVVDLNSKDGNDVEEFDRGVNKRDTRIFRDG